MYRSKRIKSRDIVFLVVDRREMLFLLISIEKTLLFFYDATLYFLRGVTLNEVKVLQMNLPLFAFHLAHNLTEKAPHILTEEAARVSLSFLSDPTLSLN